MTFIDEPDNHQILNDLALKRARKLLEELSLEQSVPASEYSFLVEAYKKLHHKLHKTLLISDTYQREGKELNLRLEESLSNFQKLKDVALPICTVCHKIHTTDDYWERLEDYFAKNVDILFSHGICPTCVKQTYGKLGEKILARQKSEHKNSSPTPPENIQKTPQDESLSEMQELLALASQSHNPLTPQIQQTVERYTKLSRRFEKIVSMSDSYQYQLREFNLRLELMAHTDPLTGINNRGFFLELLSVEMERSQRYDRVFSILMVDLDHFKNINDTMGHGAGDEALRAFCRVLLDSELRKSDFYGRLGGEEFAIILPETELMGAAEVAERIRGNLEKTPILYDAKEFFITASIGVNEFRNGDSLETLLNRADKTMYHAKKTGRNRICLEK